MIHDGYNRRVTLGGDSEKFGFIYRPALQEERERLLYDMDFLGDGAAGAMGSKFLESHIVATDWPSRPAAMQREREDLYRALFLTVLGLREDDSGEVWKDVERSYQENLIAGVELERTNPRLAKRSCEECQKLWFSVKTGLVILDNFNQPMERAGPTPCETELGCPKGTPDKQKSLNLANRWAFSHFRDCDSIGQFPDDPIVARNARLIRQVIKSVDAKRAKLKAA